MTSAANISMPMTITYRGETYTTSDTVDAWDTRHEAADAQGVKAHTRGEIHGMTVVDADGDTCYPNKVGRWAKAT